MLRIASSSIARQSVARASRSASAVNMPGVVSFHASSSRKEEEETKDVTLSKGGFMNTGYSEWLALPIGMATAVPVLSFDWYVVNEETQLAAAFVAFCVIVYTQGGDAIHAALDENAKTILKEQREDEEQVIDAMEKLIVSLEGQQENPEIVKEMNAMRLEAYKKMNEAGAIKPKHDLKVQVERMLNMIAAEEASNSEKTKTALMEECAANVSKQFASDKALKKSALDAAIASIKGTGSTDPVKGAFVKFFQDKSAQLAKVKDDTTEKDQRVALLAKANSVAENEGYFFRFDDKGVPTLV
uniref:ATP synthase subunit b n=1 Tax=Proboscia inermis TaxID=420281 RepID=A0A7S0GI52_9STRA|mmetsp:Transcript_37493/g.37837  ORF Transcript_37493/g.37837 Transcript_37493/m.37837 type:complete len:300 (+) Transcript_37493:91-990(+)